MSAPEPTVDPIEIEAVAGRERFGFGTLDRPGKGCVIVARLGLGGFGKDNLNQIAQEFGGPLPGAFLALHRRRLKQLTAPVPRRRRRLRRNWQALFDNEECRANLDDDEITFEAFWQECLDDK